MKGRPVYLRASGHCSARGNGLAAVADAVLRGDTAHATRTLAGRKWPFFALPANGADAFDAAEAAVSAVGAQLRRERLLSEALWREMPLFIGSSSGFVGLLENSCVGDDLPAAAAFADQIAAWLGVRSTPWCFSTACTSSMAALDAAATLIASGAIDHAVVLGIELANATTLAGFASLELLSSDCCRPLDRHRDGMVLGEAVAGILLSCERPDDAAASCWRLAGLDMRLDAHSLTGPRPDGAIVAEAMQSAMAQAGVGRGAIDLIKLQASGSPTADLAEARAIVRIFAAEVPPLVSLKPYFGHTLGASGAVELTALTACLERGKLPATPGFAEIDPQVGLAPTQVSRDIAVRHALFNLSGFGGTAAAVIARQQR
jgi:3-oxoacyl-[acyl-carrier-protein] synthase-1